MLEGCKSAKERWGGVSDLIDGWLNERQNMLVLYCSMTGADPQGDDSRPLQEKLRNFCQLLVDYVSAGHFEIYEQLEQEAVEFGDKDALASSQQLFKAIQKNTGACLDFNDSCETLGNIAELQATLSMIGETLEERFSLEDQLIAMLHNSHKDEAGEYAVG
ncbi:sigma D regulator [Parendozoicomonas haliclonae]|uniref:Regulator of sigma D n=2 Tax=Parendozoicomonas haliclonae TaxID=1960125 RepID=A0A1X7AIT7_9GAMM|nr:sigma D regulator [Parendozoicomonas haliclonae]SMA45708.1 Regulator of sigma D [Parendozoicomonas haliclonae]